MSRRLRLVLRPRLRALTLAGVLLGSLAAACGGGGSGGSPQREDGGSDARAPDDGSTPLVDAGTGGPVIDKITNAGAACSDDTDCVGEGTGRCITAVQEYTFPSGYCTTNCIADSECGVGAKCPLAPLLDSPLIAVLGQYAAMLRDVSSCFATCAGPGDCRSGEGYRCGSVTEILPGVAMLGIDTTTQYCLPPAPDAGTVFEDGGLDAGADADVPDADPPDADVDASSQVDAGGGVDAGNDGGPDAGAAPDVDAGVDAAPAG